MPLAFTGICRNNTAFVGIMLALPTVIIHVYVRVDTPVIHEEYTEFAKAVPNYDYESVQKLNNTQWQGTNTILNKTSKWKVQHVAKLLVRIAYPSCTRNKPRSTNPNLDCSQFVQVWSQVNLPLFSLSQLIHQHITIGIVCTLHFGFKRSKRQLN